MATVESREEKHSIASKENLFTYGNQMLMILDKQTSKVNQIKQNESAGLIF